MSATAVRKETLAPAEKVAAFVRAKRLESGEVRIPLACPTCFSPSLGLSEEGGNERLVCLSCSRETKRSLARRIRQQRIKRYLLDGAL